MLIQPTLLTHNTHTCSSDLRIIQPTWRVHKTSLFISYGDFPKLKSQFSNFIPPDIAEWSEIFFLSGQRWHGMRSLSDTSTCHQQGESKPNLDNCFIYLAVCTKLHSKDLMFRYFKCLQWTAFQEYLLKICV